MDKESPPVEHDSVEPTPLYVSIPQAAKIAGVSKDMMRKWADAVYKPIPHITSGRKKLIRVSAIEAYAMTKERI